MKAVVLLMGVRRIFSISLSSFSFRRIGSFMNLEQDFQAVRSSIQYSETVSKRVRGLLDSLAVCMLNM
jgi:hypothetical protein